MSVNSAICSSQLQTSCNRQTSAQAYSPPQVCLIGVTGFGEIHYNDYLDQHQRGLMQLAAATIINPEACPDKYEKLQEIGCKIYNSADLMLSDWSGKADLCSIPTGIPLHRPMTVAALEAGMNVFVEKPIAATVQDVRAMQQAAHKYNKWIAVGYQTMYAHETMVMKETLLSGKLGTVESIKYYALWPRDDNYYSRNNWAGKLKVGNDWVLDSPFSNAIVHQLNMILFLAGSKLHCSALPTSVEAELYRARSIESPDTAAIRIYTDSNIPVYTWVTHVPDSANEGPFLEAKCSKGRIYWPYSGEMRIEPDGQAPIVMAAQKGPGGSNLRQAIMDRLRLKLVDESAFVCTPEIAAAPVIAINTIHDAIDVVDFPDDMVKVDESNNQRIRQVSGLSELIRNCYEQEKLFSELGVSWAKVGTASSKRYTVDGQDFPAREIKLSWT